MKLKQKTKNKNKSTVLFVNKVIRIDVNVKRTEDELKTIVNFAKSSVDLIF